MKLEHLVHIQSVDHTITNPRPGFNLVVSKLAMDNNPHLKSSIVESLRDHISECSTYPFSRDWSYLPDKLNVGEFDSSLMTPALQFGGVVTEDRIVGIKFLTRHGTVVQLRTRHDRFHPEFMLAMKDVEDASPVVDVEDKAT